MVRARSNRARLVAQRSAGTDRERPPGPSRRRTHELRPCATGPDSELVRDAIKDPYNFEFLGLSKKAKERELEIALLNDVQSFLMEMGRGFALVGRQFPLKIVDEETGEEDEFFIDVLFYNYLLRRFVVIDLKVEDFKPEFTGKMSFYLTTSSIHKDGREGEHGHHHAPPARPWRGVGMILTLIKTAFITAKTHPRSRSQARLHKDGYLLVRGQGARARSRTFVSTGPALPSGRRPSPRRISGFVPVADPGSFAPPANTGFAAVADPGSFVSRPIPLRGLIGRETKGPGLLPWLSHSSEAPASGSRCSANSAVPARR